MENHDQLPFPSKKKKISRHIARVLLALLAAVAIICVIFAIVQSRYNGDYFMRGYGLAFKVRFGFVSGYQATDSFYCEDSNFNGIIIGDTLFSGMGRFEVEKNGDNLQFLDAGAQKTYDLYREVDSFFKNKSEVASDNPDMSLKMYYEMLSENYAFFDLYGVDWEERYEAVQSKYSSGDMNLVEAIRAMVEGVEDGHINISYQDEEFSPAGDDPEWISDKTQQKVLSELITTEYVKDYQKFEDVYIRYGYLSEDTGYIVMHAMGVASFDKAKTTRQAMEKILSEYSDKDITSVVIDIRFNSGGYDEASLCVAGYFTDERYMAYQQQTFYKGDYTELQTTYVEPSGMVFDQDVYILTSEYTISAAETFLRAMLANPSHRVTVVGETTAGFYSDAFERVLPSGEGTEMYYTFSNERYIGHDGMMLEGQGIVPDVLIPVSVDSALEGHDDALDYVLGEVEARNAS